MRWNAIYLSIPAHPSLSRCDKKFLRKPRRKYADGKCVIRDLTYCSAGWANLSEIFLLAGVGEIWLVFVDVQDGDRGFQII